MKSGKVFWSSILLLAILGLGACAQLATQQKGVSPTAQQEQEKEERREAQRESGA